MKFSDLTQRLAPADMLNGIDAWEVHTLAVARQDAGEEIVILSIGQEDDEVTPALIVDAAIDSLRAGRHHYSDISGTDELRSAIANYHTNLTDQAVSAEDCVVYAGAQNALFAVAQVLLQTGDEVILSEPFYTTYAATFCTSGATVVSVPVTRKNNYQLGVNDIRSALTDHTQAIVLNSPNNPMGTCYSLAEFEDIVALCIQRQLWLILDGVYLDIVDKHAVAYPHHIPGSREILITVGSLSKSHRMTGWRLGWAIGPPPLSSHLSQLSLCMHYGLPTFIMDAAVTALTEGLHVADIVRKQLFRRRRIALNALQQIEPAVLIDSGQGMFMVLDIADMRMSAREFALQLLEHHAVAVLPCDGFGKAGQSLVRIGLCVDDNKLHNACLQIVAFIANRTPNPM